VRCTESASTRTTRGFVGRKILLIVHGILEQPENRQIMSHWVLSAGSISFVSLSDVLQMCPKTPTLKHHTINYLRDTSTKSFDYTLAVLKKLERQARRELQRLDGNPMLSAILEKLHVDE